MHAETQTWDAGIAWRLAAAIIIALTVVYVIQAAGFRFVVAGSVKGGLG